MDTRPVFMLQIVTPEGDLVRLPGGSNLEFDLIEACVAKIKQRPTGMLRTEAQVEKAVREGIAEAIDVLKRQTRYCVGPNV